MEKRNTKSDGIKVTQSIEETTQMMIWGETQQIETRKPTGRPDGTMQRNNICAVEGLRELGENTSRLVFGFKGDSLLK